jgi:hypothetical protein
LDAGIATLITDGANIELHTDDLDNEMKQFHLVSDNALARNSQVVDIIMDSASVYKDVQKTLLDTIERVQRDAEYIPRADAVNSTVKNLIELEKVKVSTLALLK